MRFTAFLCLFALITTSAVAFPIKTRDEQASDNANIGKTMLYDMIFGKSKVQKPSSQVSGRPMHVHDKLKVRRHSKPVRNTVHLHQREQPPHATK